MGLIKWRDRSLLLSSSPNACVLLWLCPCLRCVSACVNAYVGMCVWALSMSVYMTVSFPVCSALAMSLHMYVPLSEAVSGAISMSVRELCPRPCLHEYLRLCLCLCLRSCMCICLCHKLPIWLDPRWPGNHPLVTQRWPPDNPEMMPRLCKNKTRSKKRRQPKNDPDFLISIHKITLTLLIKLTLAWVHTV